MYRGRFRTVLRAVQIRGFFDHHILYVFLILLSVGFLILGKIDPATVEKTKIAVIDSIIPILDKLSQPVATVSEILSDIRAYGNLHEENHRLRSENVRLEGWRQTALQYEFENAQLRSLLHVPGQVPVHYVSARVVAHSGGPFVRALVANAGYENGVRNGQVVVVVNGLVGRVNSLGSHSARILLLTDLNSRVPVLTASSEYRAILAGDNTPWPRLIHLPGEHDLQVGEKIVTSGHGGVFPPGLIVGEVVKVEEKQVRVKTAVDFDEITFVRIAEYGLSGIVSDRE